ncbi:MAG: hypothetical protein V3S24_23870, partial [Candidatus Tectomicrobia bacterium]
VIPDGRISRVRLATIARKHQRSARCWAQGFHLLSCYPSLHTQLRNLDRSRHRQIARLRRTLHTMTGFPKTAPAHDRNPAITLIGRPYSYDAIADIDEGGAEDQ